MKFLQILSFSDFVLNLLNVNVNCDFSAIAARAAVKN